ncbi:MAG: hypothetical protein ACI8Y4_004066 [Candidatus Poriferisodalaceae bacterium]|jgi:hypothetical protein
MVEVQRLQVWASPVFVALALRGVIALTCWTRLKRNGV